jgi:hypothetical protein
MILELSKASQWRADLARHGRNPALVMRGKVLLDTLPTIGENDVTKQAKTCAYVLCGEPFIAQRKDQIYCDKGTCKMAAYRLRNHGYETTDLADILARARDAELQSHGVAGTNHSDVSRAKRYREDALRAAYDAIARELGFELETHDVQNEPENDASPDPLEPHVLRANLREFMAETGYGQSRIAKLADVNQSTVSLFVRNLTDGSEAFRRALWAVISQDHGVDRR